MNFKSFGVGGGAFYMTPKGGGNTLGKRWKTRIIAAGKAQGQRKCNNYVSPRNRPRITAYHPRITRVSIRGPA